MAGELAAFATVGRSGVAATSVFAGLSNAQMEYERAIGSGANEDQAFDQFLITLPTGGLEALPIASALGRMRSLGYLTQGTGAPTKLAGALLSGSIGAVEEFITESLTAVWTNYTAGQIYDDTREIFSSTDLVNSLAGAAAGGILAGGLGGIATFRQQASNLQDFSTLLEAERLIRLKDDPEFVGSEFATFNGTHMVTDNLGTIAVQPPNAVDPDAPTFAFDRRTTAKQAWESFKRWFAPNKGLDNATAARIERARWDLC